MRRAATCSWRRSTVGLLAVSGSSIVDPAGTGRTCPSSAQSGRIAWSATSALMVRSTRSGGSSSLEKKLCPNLYPGDIVVLDNLRVHKNARGLELIRATGAEVKFQPPYCCRAPLMMAARTGYLMAISVAHGCRAAA